MSQTPRVPPSGNAVIDHQHARLNQLIHQAVEAARDGGTGDAFALSLQEFRDALAQHFDMERLIISGAGFDGVPRHHQTHGTILAQLDAALASAHDLTAVTRRHQVLDRFEQVLLEHEMVEDAVFWDAVRAHAGNPPLKWREMMTLGVDWIDAQHRHMTELFNEASRAAAMGRHDECGHLLDGFVSFAQHHFREEERHLEDLGRPAAEHRREHGRLGRHLERLRAGGFSPAVLVEHYLRFWMIDHILGIDQVDLAG